MKLKVLILVMSLIPIQLFAQFQLSGKIVDEKNDPLIGVAIKIKNTQKGVITNIDGNFTISVNVGDTIVSMMLGYKITETKIENDKPIKIIMHEDVKRLEEVVVVAYEKVSRKDLTGSVGEINVEGLNKARVPNIDMSLSGRMAGVQVNASDAQPGSELNIVVRGASSLAQSNAPLYVIDGFPMEDFNSAALNPADIASFNILKDASATAMYGSRGSNGVVIIETKQGKMGKPTVAYEGTFGFQQVVKTMELMNPYEHVKYHIERDPGRMTSMYLTSPGLVLDDYRNVENIDWQNYLFRLAPIMIHNMSMSGGNVQTRYHVSGSFTDQKGIVINSGFNKYQGRVRLDQRISDKFDVGLNLNYSVDKNYGQTASSQGLSSNSYSTYLMYRVWGYRPMKMENDDIFEDLYYGDSENTAILNPIISSNNELRQQKTDMLTINGTLGYNIQNNLKLRIRGGLNRRDRVDERFNNSKTHGGFRTSYNPNGVNGSYSDSKSSNWVNENILSYNKRFDRNNRVDLIGAVTFQGTQSSIYGYRVIKIPNEELGLSGMSEGTPSSVTSINSENRMFSYLARVNYNYKSRYSLTASFRADASSKFAPDKRWGYFPSAAFAWRMSEEKFIKNLKFVNDAKLRISYGITGNNRLYDYSRYQNLAINDYYSFGNKTPQYALGIQSMGNSDLVWEKTAQSNIGYDLSILKKRIDLTIDLYEKKTTDLLINAKIPYSSGRGTAYKNIGSTRNRGLEFTLNTINIQTKDFQWRSNFNISFNKSRVLKLTEDQESILSTVSWTSDWNLTYLYMTRIGNPVSVFYGLVWDGNYQYDDFNILTDGTLALKDNIPTNGKNRENIRPGDIKFIDQNGDRVVNDMDYVVIGNPLPKHIGGFNNDFMYKNFNLNIFFQWSYGNDIMNANRIMLEGNPTNSYINQYATYANRWTPDNPSNSYFRIGGGEARGVYSSRTIEDGSFIRLKNVQLSYSLPAKIINQIGGNSLEVYLSASNLYTWTKYSGMDPEVSVRNTTLTPGFDFSAYPQSRTLMGGVKVVF